MQIRDEHRFVLWNRKKILTTAYFNDLRDVLVVHIANAFDMEVLPDDLFIG